MRTCIAKLAHVDPGVIERLRRAVCGLIEVRLKAREVLLRVGREQGDLKKRVILGQGGALRLALSPGAGPGGQHRLHGLEPRMHNPGLLSEVFGGLGDARLVVSVSTEHRRECRHDALAFRRLGIESTQG